MMTGAPDTDSVAHVSLLAASGPGEEDEEFMDDEFEDEDEWDEFDDEDDDEIEEWDEEDFEDEDGDE
jgi:hypothetical protein